MIYLDHAATTAPCRAAIDASVEMMEKVPYNPSSVHSAGLDAARAVRSARADVAHAIGCRPDEVVFTAGGSEADNLAIFGGCMARQRRGNHIVTSAVEHPAVKNTCRSLEKMGFTVTEVKTGADGCVSVADVMSAVTDKTVLVSVMSVCNETGALMPVEQIAAGVKRKYPDVWMHTDCVQSFLKEKISLANIDLLSVSGHKVCAPKGIGALYVKKGIRPLPLINGGGQEGGLRSGTEAVPLIAAFAAACREGERNFSQRVVQMRELRKAAETELARVPGLKFLTVNGVSEVFTVFLPGYKSEVLLRYLSEKGIYVSAGSACAKGKKSEVLTAMGIDSRLIDSALRISPGTDNTPEDFKELADTLICAENELVKTGK